MNERLVRFISEFEKTFNNLKYAAESANNDLEIDGAIKRFELCYELSWKLIKEYLANIGIICKNPRDCFKEAVNNNLIQDSEKWLKMIEDRNLLVHTYNFENSRSVFNNIRDDYIREFEILLKEVKNGE